MATAGNATAPFAATGSSSSSSSTPTPESNAFCRQTEWHIILGSSLGTYVTLLIAIIIGRVLCHSSVEREDDPVDIRRRHGHPSLLTRLQLYCMALMKGSNTLGKVLLVLYSLCVIASFLIYILLTYKFTDAQKVPTESRTLLVCYPASQFPVVHVDFAINIFYFFVFLLRMASCQSIQTFWLSIDTIADHLTLIPSVVMYSLNKHVIAFQFARLTGLKFLVNALIYCNIVRSEKYIRLVSMLIRIIALWTISAGFYQLIESVGDFWRTDGVTNEIFRQYHDCFYFMLITMSTVGYGDIYPHTVLGKFFIIIFIAVALGTFTSIIPEVSDILTENKKYRKNRIHLKSGKKHVVVVGRFTVQMMKTFFNDFFHSERVADAREFIAMLGIDEPDLELKALIKTRELYVTYLQGSVMCVKDLQRACVRDASAVIVIADPQARNEEDEDMKNIMRVIAIKDYSPEVQVLVQLQLYRSKTYLRNIPDWSPSHGDQAICINEIKYGILAQSCLVPGLSTLLCNLLMLRSCNTSRFPAFSWEASYLNGVEFEFYKVAFSSSFHGLTFLKAAEVCIDQLGIVLLAVEEGTCTHRRTIINPGASLRIDTDRMQAFVIAKDEREARRVSSYNAASDAAANTREHASSTVCCGCASLTKRVDPAREQQAEFLNSVRLNNIVLSSSERPQSLSDVKPNATPVKGKRDSGNASLQSPAQRLQIGDSQVGCDGANEFLLDSSGYFHWMPNHPMDEVLLQSQIQYSFTNHIVVCIMEKNPDVCLNLTTFIMPLRASCIQVTKLKDIVFIGAIDVIRNEWSIIQNFPSIHVLDGSPLNRANLKAVNIESCYSCIILSPKSTPFEPDAQMDRETILCTLNIKTMRNPETRRKLGDTIHILTELNTEDAIAYLDQDDETEVEEPYMTQAFATGRTFFLSLLGSIVTTIYFNQASLSFLRTIVTTVDSEDFEIDLNEQGFHFMPSDHVHTLAIDGAQTPAKGSHRRSRIELLDVSSPPLRAIFTATNPISWKEFSLAVLMQLETVCIGLSRLQIDTGEDAKNHRFVMTLPQDSVIVRSTDLVYCLTPPNLVL